MPISLLMTYFFDIFSLISFLLCYVCNLVHTTHTHTLYERVVSVLIQRDPYMTKSICTQRNKMEFSEKKKESGKNITNDDTI